MKETQCLCGNKATLVEVRDGEGTSEDIGPCFYKVKYQVVCPHCGYGSPFGDTEQATLATHLDIVNAVSIQQRPLHMKKTPENGGKGGVTVGDLTEMLVRLQQLDPDRSDLEVVVRTVNQGVPHGYMAVVDRVSLGFDWTMGLFIISTRDNLVVEKKITQPLSEYARERLDRLKKSYEKLGFGFIKKSGETHWIDGFKEGVRSRVTDISEEDKPRIRLKVRKKKNRWTRTS